MEFAIDNELKAELKSKWLAYYKQNITWIVDRSLNKNTNCENQGLYRCRPSSDLIMSVIIALEPKLSALMPFWCKFRNLDQIVEMLGLDFDPDFVIAREELEKVGIKEVETINLLPENQS